MAKKKKTTKRHYRRRMSGIGGDTTQTLMGLVVGVVAGKALTKVTSSMMGLTDPAISGGIQIIGGAFLVPKFIKSGLGKGIGLGMAANGTGALLTSFGILSGMGLDEPQTYHVVMNGTDKLNTVNGTDRMRVINGPGEEPVRGSLHCINGINEDDDDREMIEEMRNRTRAAMGV
jgi:hypothetical protein